MKKQNKFIITIGVFCLLLSSIFIIYSNNTLDANFNCRGRVYIKDMVTFSPCTRKSAFDIFFNMNNNGTGYMIISGTSARNDEQNVTCNAKLINYTYKKDGDYYSLVLGPRDQNTIRLAKELRYDTLKIKITHANSNNYIIATPIETIMMCTTKIS